MSKNFKAIATMAIGVLAVILSIVCFSMDIGGTERNEIYGGDAYTGIQNAAAQTTRNVKALASIAKFGFGSILLVAGCYLIVTSLPEKEQDKGHSKIEQDDNIKKTIIPADQAIDLESELREYKDLLDKGILTEEEFEAKKAELLRIGKPEHPYSGNNPTASFTSDNTNIETNDDFRDLPEI